MNYIFEIDKLCTKFRDDVQNVIASYQENVLNPFCDKYRLNFYQANGAWVFEDVDEKFDIHECELFYNHNKCICTFNTYPLHESRLGNNKAFKKELYTILEFLNKEIYSQDYVQYGFSTYRTNGQ